MDQLGLIPTDLPNQALDRLLRHGITRLEQTLDILPARLGLIDSASCVHRAVVAVDVEYDEIN